MSPLFVRATSGVDASSSDSRGDGPKDSNGGRAHLETPPCPAPAATLRRSASYVASDRRWKAHWSATPAASQAAYAALISSALMPTYTPETNASDFDLRSALWRPEAGSKTDRALRSTPRELQRASLLVVREAPLARQVTHGRWDRCKQTNKDDSTRASLLPRRSRAFRRRRDTRAPRPPR